MFDNIAKILIQASDQTAAAFQSALGNLNKVDKASDSLNGKLKGVLGGLAAGVSVVALKSMFDGIVFGAAAMDDLAEKTGASVESLSKLSPVAKLAGIDMGTVGNALTSLSKRLMGVGDEGEAGAGKGAAKQLAELGLSARTAAGELKDPAELMVEIANKLGEYRDGMGKTQVAQNLFGKSGAELLPFLKDLAEYGELTARMTANQAAEAEKYEKNLKRLSIMGDAWKKELAFGILPVATAFSEALIDNKKEVGGLGDKIKELKQNGSIQEFAEDGARGIAILIDAVRHGVGAFKMLAASLDVLGEGGKLAWVKLQNATDTRMQPGMKKILEDRARAAKGDAEQRLKESVDAYREIPEFLSKVEEKLAAMRAKSGAAAGGDKKPGMAGSAGGGGKAGADRVSDIEKAIQASRERVGALDAEMMAEDKLTESQKRAMVLMVQLRDGKLAGTETERQALAVALEAELIRDRENEKRKQAIELLKEEAKQINKRTDEAIKSAADAEKEAEQQRLANEEIGLTQERLYMLKQARLDDAIAIREQSLAAAEKTSTSAAEIEAMKEQIDAMRRLRTLRDEGQVKQVAADAAKKAEEDWKRTSDNIERSLTDSLMRGFENGKSSAQNFRDTLKNMINTLVLRPLIEAPIKPFAEGLSKMVSGSGGIGGMFSGLFGGGGGGNYNFVNDFGMPDVGLGFANGGSFMVGGSGGTDSQTVAFRASPDERVTIETPGQRSGQGGGAMPTIIVNNTINPAPGNDRNALASMAAQIEANTVRKISALFTSRGFKAEGAALA